MKISINKKYKTIRDGYPVRIICTNRIDSNGYTIVGLRNFEGNEYPNYFNCEGKSSLSGGYDLVEVSLYEDYKIDEPLFVSNDGENWYKRHFAGESIDGYPRTWVKGLTSWTTEEQETWIWHKK